jgi:hypothetical protein
MESTYMMNGWIILVILYIIFMMISSLAARKSRTRKVSPLLPQQKEKEKAPKDLQAKFEGYFEKIEEYFGEKKPPPLPQQQPQEAKILSVPPNKQQRLELYPEEIQPKSTSTRRLVQDEEPLPELQLIHSSEFKVRKPSSILSFDKTHGYIQGIILSEILGPPLSKRHRRGFR